MLRKTISLAVLVGLLMVSGGGPGLAAPLPPASAWQSKVDPWVLETVAGGKAEFLVFLAEQADLSAAAGLPTKLEKGRYVYETLTQTAARTQGPVLAALKALGAEHQPFWVANMIWVRGDAAVLAALAARPDVAHVYANPSVQMAMPAPEAGADGLAAPEAPATIEWNISKVNAPAVWAAGYTGQGAVIAGQDTGYQWDHPALKGKYRGWNGAASSHDYNWHDAIHTTGSSCGADSPFPCDDHGHGTHTMGTMAGDDGGANQIGMAPGAKWIGCRNMNAGAGTPTTYAECYQWFIAPTRVNGQDPNPAMAPDVINNSWGCPPSEGCTDPNVLLTVVNNVRAAGIVTVHSAGNSGSACSTIAEPSAIYDASFTVGSTTNTDTISSFSSRGPVTVDGSNRLKPNISAPGDGVRSSLRGSTYTTMSGTSMAGPHVAGLVALLISAQPSIAGQVDYIEDVIEQSAVRLTSSQTCGGVPGSSIPNNTFGWGRIDALAAYNLLRNAFTLAVSPASASVCMPADASFTVTLTPALASYPGGPAALGVSGPPAGATASFSPNPAAVPGSSLLTISNTGAAAPGTYPLTITGSAGLPSASASAQLLLRSVPAAVSGLAISRFSATQVRLTWSSVAGANSYQVWRSANQPYFTPGADCASPAPYACATTKANSYLNASLGDPANNFTYVVRAVNACGASPAGPGRVGEFDYGVIPGN